MELIVSRDGTIQFIYVDDLAGLFVGPRTRRVSNVEPTDDGEWTANMGPVGGKVLGPFILRQDALDAEMDWLAGEMIQGPLPGERT